MSPRDPYRTRADYYKEKLAALRTLHVKSELDREVFIEHIAKLEAAREELEARREREARARVG